jgi:hypothetical protein
VFVCPGYALGPSGDEIDVASETALDIFAITSGCSHPSLPVLLQLALVTLLTSTVLLQAQLAICCCDAESDAGENHEWRRSNVRVAHPLVLCERRAVMEVIRP